MRKHLEICFELGYTVEDMTEFYNRLVELFGYAGSVEREKDGQVKDFKVQTDFGVLELNFEKNVLRLQIRDSGELLSEEIWKLYNILKRASVIRSDKTWCVKVSYVFEVV